MGRTNRNRGDFSSIRVGAYGIRPTNEHIRGQMNQKRTRSVVHLFTYNGERVNQYVPSLPFDEIMGAYAIRPYPDGRKGGGFFVRCWSGKVCFGGDGLLLFVGKMKIGGFWVQIFLRDRERANQYVRLLFSDGTMGAYAIRSYPDARKGGVFFVRRRSGMGWLGGGGLLLSIDIVWKGIRELRDVGRDRK